MRGCSAGEVAAAGRGATRLLGGGQLIGCAVSMAGGARACGVAFRESRAVLERLSDTRE
jgi:hypothetical protein